MAGYDWDESQWPLVRVTVRPEVSAAENDEMYDRFRKMLARKTVCALVHDSRQAPPVGAIERQKVAQLMAELEPLAQRYMAGAAVVLSSAVQRGIMTAILWIRPARYPLVILSSVEAGETWAREQLRLRREGAPASQR